MAKAVAHPLRARVLARLQEDVASPKELAAELGEPLGNVAYHVKTLKQLGCIEQARWEQRRGAIEHYYRAVTATTLPDMVVTLPLSVRAALSSHTATRAIQRISAALEAGQISDAKAISMTHLRLDEQAWTALAPLVDAVAARARELEAESRERGGGTSRDLTLMLYPSAD